MIINGIEYTQKKLAGMIDQTLLAADATEIQIRDLCRTARRYEFKSVCTNLYWTPIVTEELKDSCVDVCFVVGYPLGSVPTSCKVFEAREGIRLVAGKSAAIDMVTNIGLLKDKNYKQYTSDIQQVVAAGHDRGLEVKAILETGALTEDEIRKACACAAEAGVDFVKTSTGRGAMPLVKDVIVMKSAVPAKVGIKYSGFGNVNPTQLTIMGIKAGASRLGSPVGAMIVEEAEKYYGSLNI